MTSDSIHETSTQSSEDSCADACLEVLCSFGFKPVFHVSNDPGHMALQHKKNRLYLVKDQESYKFSLTEPGDVEG